MCAVCAEILLYTYCAHYAIDVKGVVDVKIKINCSFTNKMYVFLFLILIISSVVFSTSYAAISEEKAKELIYQYCMNNLRLSKDDFEIYNFLKNSKGNWVFSLKLKDRDMSTNGLVIGEISPDGKLIKLDPPKPIPLFEQLREAIIVSQRSYSDVYTLSTQWQSILRHMSDEEQADFEHFPSRKIMLDFINHDIRLPSSTDISYDVAKEKSREAILNLSGWTHEMLDHL